MPAESSSPFPFIDGDALKAFAFDIRLPDENFSRFYIFHDLAELFGEEFNADALARLRRLLREHPENPRGKLTTDWEADFVSLSASKPDVILLVARLINENAISPHRRDLSEEQYAAILTALRGWKRRKPKPWRIGDVFCFRLPDSRLGYGQVLYKEYDAPTCALFEIRSEEPLPVEEVRKARVISILHVGGDLLNKGAWQVLGNTKIVANPNSGPTGSRNRIGGESWGSGEPLQELAEAYYGLRPWNVGLGGDDRWYDKQLMPGIKRPKTALILSPAERRAYREKHGILA